MGVIFEAFPKQQQFIDAVASLKYRFMLYGGAIRGGKTFVLLAIILLLCKIYPKSRWAIVRKDLQRLKKTTLPAIEKICEGVEVTLHRSDFVWTFPNGSKFFFFPENLQQDPDLNRFKGLEVNGFIIEEMNEVSEKCFRKCIERAGSWLIHPVPSAGQPPPFILGSCNPSQGWVKEMFYNRWKEGTLPKDYYYLSANIFDNPYLTEDYKNSLKNLPLYEYKVFVEGDWDVVLKGDNAFWHAFEFGEHIAPEDYNRWLPVHVSMDANSLPYCAVSFWQLDLEERKIVQFHEIPVKYPRSHPEGVAQSISEYLKEIGYDNVFYLYGDASMKSQNTIDPQKRSFLKMVEEELSLNWNFETRIADANPPINMTGAFVNALYGRWNGWRIVISEFCKESISDYSVVKVDENGAMAKKRITDENGDSYEESGHFSDTKRYFIYKALSEEYSNWKNRFDNDDDQCTVMTVEQEESEYYGDYYDNNNYNDYE